MEYSEKEEKVNVITHASGIVMALISGLILIWKAGDDIYKLSSFVVFIITMLFSYSMSTIYHYLPIGERKRKFRVYDHIAIFLLIAGSYTPFLLVPLREVGGWTFFIIVWAIGVFGTIFKFFFTGRYKLLSSLLYLGMGWIVVFAGQDLFTYLNPFSLQYLIVGGVSYSIGVIFYSLKKMSYSHGIFHMFVLGGTFCHIVAIYSL